VHAIDRPTLPASVTTHIAGLPCPLHEPRDGYRARPENAALPYVWDQPPTHTLDLGAGSGILGLLACAAGAPTARATLVERHPTLAMFARTNAEQPWCADRVDVIEADLRDAPSLPHADLVVLNPPFFAPGTGRPSSNDTSHHATHALYGGLEEFLWCAAAHRSDEGAIAVLYPADHVARVWAAAVPLGLVPRRVVLLHARHTGLPYRAWTLLTDGRSADSLEVVVASTCTRR
jgi:tRNA1Val (adenine37-N6)-methyltransferase